MSDPHALTSSPPPHAPVATVRSQGHPTVLLDPLPFDPAVAYVAAAAAQATAARLRWVGRHDENFGARDPDADDEDDLPGDE